MDDFVCTLKAGAVTRVRFTDMKGLSEYLSSISSALFVADENSSYAIPENLSDRCLVLSSGEEHKNYDSLFKIIRKALGLKLSRSSRFVGVGGGVVSDMTAFASSVYMRGAKLTIVPSTLLSMVDASLGGKSAIDFDGVKNLVGTFYPADDVIIVPVLLKTLPEGEFLSGLGEVIKHAFLTKDKSLYHFLLENKDGIMAREEETLGKMVELSLKVKKEYIEKDPEEKLGIRSALNLGHTFAHALESITNYEVKHGIAVAWGLEMALAMGVEMAVTPADLKESVDGLLSLYGYDTSLRIEKDKVPIFLSYKEKDKKRDSSGVQFITLSGWGGYVKVVPDDNLIAKLVAKV